MSEATSLLFTPYDLAGLTLPNRVVIAPMCQYSAEEGSATDWHMLHLGSLAVSGAGLLVIEATAVEAQGRITPGDLGLYSDANERALGRVLEACRRYGNTRIGIQLAHAGRKASAHLPWDGGLALKPEDGAWETSAPSAIPFTEGWHTPKALTRDGLQRVRDAFVATAKRADRIGIDVAELHAAHGYLLHEFLSPLSNHRDDDYGGSPEKRMRFPLEVAAAVREAWPQGKPLGARITGSDWVEGGLTPDDAVTFAKALKKLGFDYVCVSSGGNSPRARIEPGPGYQVPFAQKVKAEAGIATRAVGLIAGAGQAEAILKEGKADMIAMARAILDDPHWVWHAAEALGAPTPAYPVQYLRSQAKLWPGAALARG